MENKLVTLAIHKTEKAHILKRVLEDRGIDVYLENVDKSETNSNLSTGIYIRIKESDLSKALSLIESNNLFNYSSQQISLIDDGRKRILVAVDFSDYSLNACKAAFSIAKNTDAKVKILNVFNTRYPLSFPFADTLIEEKDETLLDKTRRQMLDFCNIIDKKISDKEFPSVNYSYSIREGIVEEEINSFVEEYRPMIIVVGMKGKDNNKVNGIGNVTADIIEITNIPVFAVPGSYQIANGTSVKHIAYLTNFLKQDLESFNYFVNLLRPYKQIKITLLHVNIINKKGDKWTEIELIGMREYFNSQFPELEVDYKLIDTIDLVEGVHEFIEKNDIDTIVLNSRKRNLFSRMFIPSISHKMIKRSDIALLVLRN